MNKKIIIGLIAILVLASLAGLFKTKESNSSGKAKNLETESYVFTLPSAFQIKNNDNLGIISFRTKKEIPYYIHGEIKEVRKNNYTEINFSEKMELNTIDEKNKIIKESYFDAGGIMAIYTICPELLDHCWQLIAGSDESPTGKHLVLKN